jgi:hypothetical protein
LNSVRVEPFRGGELTNGLVDPIFDTYGRNAWKSRIRAHPDVAERHHGITPGAPARTY